MATSLTRTTSKTDVSVGPDQRRGNRSGIHLLSQFSNSPPSSSSPSNNTPYGSSRGLRIVARGSRAPPRIANRRNLPPSSCETLQCGFGAMSSSRHGTSDSARVLVWSCERCGGGRRRYRGPRTRRNRQGGRGIHGKGNHKREGQSGTRRGVKQLLPVTLLDCVAYVCPLTESRAINHGVVFHRGLIRSIPGTHTRARVGRKYRG